MTYRERYRPKQKIITNGDPGQRSAKKGEFVVEAVKVVLRLRIDGLRFMLGVLLSSASCCSDSRFCVRSFSMNAWRGTEVLRRPYAGLDRDICCPCGSIKTGSCMLAIRKLAMRKRRPPGYTETVFLPEVCCATFKNDENLIFRSTHGVPQLP